MTKLDGELSVGNDGSHVVRFKRVIARPAAAVWRAISTPEGLKNWIGEAEVEPRVGGKIIIRFRDSSEVINGIITVFEPESVIEYLVDELGGARSRVRWEVAAQSDGCVLTLTHTAPPEMPVRELLDFFGGWHDFLDHIPEASSGVFVPYTKSIAGLQSDYRAKLADGVQPQEQGQMSRVAAVRFERLLPGPIERVWEHLTDAKLLPAWFGEDGSIEPRQGGAVSLMDGHIRGTVTKWQPPRSLSYTWNVFEPGAAADAASDYPESYLTFTLEPVGDRVLLVLSHSPILERFEKQNAMGWHTFLDLLSAAVRGEPAQPRSAFMQKNAALYGVDLQNLAT